MGPVTRNIANRWMRWPAPPDDEFREIARLKLEFYSNREISSMLKRTSRYIDRKVGEIQRLWGQIYHD